MCAALWTQRLREGLPGGPVVPDEARAGPEPARPTRGLVVPQSARTSGQRVRPLAYASCPSPFGTVHLAASGEGICRVSLYETEAAFRARLAPASWDARDADGLLAQAAGELAEYFAGRRRAFEVPLDVVAASAFDCRVLAAIAAIPYGETRTYGEVARAIGSPGAARAVGHACGGNPVPLLIACHRVVRADSGLGGYGAGGPDVKARLLALERAALPA